MAQTLREFCLKRMIGGIAARFVCRDIEKERVGTQVGLDRARLCLIDVAIVNQLRAFGAGI